MALLNLDESGERRFLHAARGYGVEVHGGDTDDREGVLVDELADPVVTVDGRTVDDTEALVEAALLEMGADEDWVAKHHLGPIDLRRALVETQSSLAILEFDSMDSDVQTSTAQMLKGGRRTDRLRRHYVRVRVCGRRRCRPR